MSRLANESCMLNFIENTFNVGAAYWKPGEKDEKGRCEFFKEGAIKRLARAMHINVAVSVNAAGVPVPGLDLKSDYNEKAWGALNFDDWKIWLNMGLWYNRMSLVESKKKQKDQQVEFWKFISIAADIIYHESRHADQWYQIAQFMGTSKDRKGLGLKAKKIKRTMGIDEAVVNTAKKNPLNNPQEIAQAVEWCKSIYPEALPNPKEDKVRNKVSKQQGRGFRMNVTDRQLTYKIQGLKQVGGQISNAVSLRGAAGYHNLPEEADAHLCGDNVQKGIYFLLKKKGLYLGEPEQSPHPRNIREQLRRQPKIL